MQCSYFKDLLAAGLGSEERDPGSGRVARGARRHASLARHLGRKVANVQLGVEERAGRTRLQVGHAVGALVERGAVVRVGQERREWAVDGRTVDGASVAPDGRQRWPSHRRNGPQQQMVTYQFHHSCRPVRIAATVNVKWRLSAPTTANLYGRFCFVDLVMKMSKRPI